MHEQSKAAKRRFNDGAFLTRYFVGRGLDIGAGPDGLSRYRSVFPRIAEVRDWDLPDGDAQFLASIPDNQFDFVHSSHSLEHMVDVRVALANWIRVVRAGGYLVILVPDEDMYERGAWPSRHNPDHKWTFTTFKRDTWSPKSINLIDMVREFGDAVEIERLNVIRDFFRPEVPGDQTQTPVAECGIEIVLKKRIASPAANAGVFSRHLVPPVGRARLKACRRGLMLYDAEDATVGRLLDAYGEYAEFEVGLFAQVLARGDVVVEVGAHIGALTAALADLVGPQGHVHAFESSERPWRHLVANATLNGLDHVRCWHADVGALRRQDDHERPADVPRMSVDELALPKCRLIKVGLDGAAAKVVEGARDTLARCRTLLHLRAENEDATRLLQKALAPTGYHMYWHVAPHCRAANYYGRPPGIYKNTATVSILAVPPDFAVSGLPQVQTSDWRRDTGIGPSASA